MSANIWFGPQCTTSKLTTSNLLSRFYLNMNSTINLLHKWCLLEGDPRESFLCLCTSPFFFLSHCHSLFSFLLAFTPPLFHSCCFHPPTFIRASLTFSFLWSSPPFFFCSLHPLFFILCNLTLFTILLLSPRPFFCVTSSSHWSPLEWWIEHTRHKRESFAYFKLFLLLFILLPHPQATPFFHLCIYLSNSTKN